MTLFIIKLGIDISNRIGIIAREFEMNQIYVHEYLVYVINT